MTGITTDSIKNFLKKIESAHAEEISSGVLMLLHSLIQCDSQAIKSTSEETITFEKDAIKANNSGLSDEALRKRVQFFNSFQETADTGLTLKSRKHFYELTVDSEKFDLAASQHVVELSKSIAETYDEKPTVQPTLRAEPTVFISHKWHQDKDLREIFNSFTSKLDDYLSNPPQGKPTVKLFYSTSKQNGFKPYSDRQTQQDSWCAQAQIGLVFWSQLYDHSPHCQTELNFFINENGINQAGKTAIVLVDHGRLKDMPERLTGRNAFFYPADNEVTMVEYWENANLSQKSNYIAALADRIYEAFEAQPPKAKVSDTAKKENRPSLDKYILDAGQNQSQETLMDEATQQPYAFHDADEKNQSVELIPVLKDWANDFGQKSTRVSVLLGDFGFGKTVSCRLINKALSDDYQEDATKAILPLYLDLKALQAEIAEYKSKPIEHLLESMLQKTGEKLSVTGEEIVQYIRKNPCLVIFDGFDEIGHHLTEAEQQTVYDSLLDIIPSEIYRQDSERLKEKPDCAKHAKKFPSKLLISCRTHFFNRVSKEESFISGSSRHALGSNGTGLKNIRRFYMAPFSAETVATYLCEVLGEVEGLRAKQLLGEIHDLSELSSHPIMLDLITRQLPQLHDQQLAGRTINSAVLYLNLFEAIGERDTGKHKIRLSDKQELLAALALHLWQKQQTSISFKHLDNWFADFGGQHRTIKNQMVASTHAMQELMQDLCNASLLVRDKDRYRFAHTSYLEFFRALGLFEVIRQHNDPSCFDSITGNATLKIDDETLQFLLNWHAVVEPEDREEFNEQFLKLLESNSKLTARELSFAIWRFAHTNKNSGLAFPHSPRANWSGMSFDIEFIPEALTSLDYSYLNLSSNHFHRITFNKLRLTSANFSNCRLSQVYFHKCSLDNSNWQDTDISIHSFWPSQSSPLKPSSNTTPLKSLHRHFGHYAGVNNIACSHDGRYLASASDDTTLRLWDIKTGECIRIIDGDYSLVDEVAFSKNDKYIISTGDDNCPKLWDVNTGCYTRSYEELRGAINRHSFSPNGKSIVAAFGDHFNLWGVDSGRCQQSFQSQIRGVINAAFSNDGQYIISTSNDATIKLWDTQTGGCLRVFSGHKYGTTHACFNHDSSHVLSTSWDALRLWDTQTGQCLRVFEGHNRPISSISFSRNGSNIVSAAYDGSIKLWDIYSDECKQTFQGHQYREGSSSVDFIDNEHFISANQDGAIKLWNIQSGDCLRTTEAHTNWAQLATFSHNSKYIVSKSDRGTLKLWDTDTGDYIRDFKEHSGDITSATFSKDDDYILSTDGDETSKIWNIQTGKCIQTFTNQANMMELAKFQQMKNHAISETNDNSFELWDEDTQTSEDSVNYKGHTQEVTSAAFSNNGKLVVSSSHDHTVKIWDSKTGSCLKTLIGHNSFVISALFNQDTSLIISSSFDNTVKLWDTKTGHCIYTILQTPEGSLCYSQEENGILPQSIRGDAWRYCYTKDAYGNIEHPCQYENWGEVYKP